MSKPSAKKLEKKKLHEKEARARVLARRAALRRKVKENVGFDQEERNAHSKRQPIRNGDYYQAKKMAAREVKSNLHANLDILEGLEAEYALENPGKSLVDSAEKALARNKIVSKLGG